MIARRLAILVRRCCRMPTVHNRSALAAIYAKAKAKIEAREIPTAFVEAGHVLYRSINPQNPFTHLPKPASGAHVSKAVANKLLIPGDGALDLNNRFSGPSYDGS